MLKLSGFAKFDLDTKISKYQFFRMIEDQCNDEEEKTGIVV